MLTEAAVRAALPPSGFVRSYVEYAENCTDANIAYHLAGALNCLTQAVPIEFCVPYASPLYGNLFTLVVGVSSHSRKTAAINIARRIAHDAIPGSVGETPGSQEGLYESLRQQQRQMIVYGEFGEFLAKAEEGYFMPLKTAYTSLFDGVPVGRALAKNKRGNIENPRLSLLCGVATDLLERHTEQADWTGGFLARFLTFYAEPEREFASMPVDDVPRRVSITDWLRNLATVTTPPGPCLWLDAKGKVMWDAWYARLKATRGDAGRRVSAACARATSLAAKIALLLSWDIGAARSGQPWHVGPVELESALKITDLHLESVLELGERVTGTRDMRDRQTVLRCIGDQPVPFGIVVRQSELLKRRVNEILDTLLEEHTIQSQDINGHRCLVRSPHLAHALASAANPPASQPGMATVVALRQPASQAAASQTSAPSGGGKLRIIAQSSTGLDERLDADEDGWSHFED